MNSQEFMDEVYDSYKRSVKVLIEKEKEYSNEDDRLSQFYEATTLTGNNPCDELVGMAVKHFTSIATMAKNPYHFPLKQWHEKTVDLRNYTFLLETLLKDMDVK